MAIWVSDTSAAESNRLYDTLYLLELIVSPTRNGLSISTETAPKRLARVSCAAKPNARPPMDRDAMRPVMLSPKFCEVTRKATMTTNTLRLFRIMGSNCLLNCSSSGPARGGSSSQGPSRSILKQDT